MKRKGVLPLCIGAVVVVAWSILWGCPLRQGLGFPCPACGLTRATVAALSGDFAVAFVAHPLFPLAWALLGGAMLYPIWEKVPKLKKAATLFFAAGGLAFVGAYLVRLGAGFPGL